RMQNALADQLAQGRARLVGRGQLEQRALGEQCGGVDLAVEGLGQTRIAGRDEGFQVALVARLDSRARGERIQPIGHGRSPIRFGCWPWVTRASAMSRSAHTMAGHSRAMVAQYARRAGETGAPRRRPRAASLAT